MTRVALWAGRSGPGRASAGALVDRGDADPETVRRAVLACGIAMAANRLTAASPEARLPVIRAFAAARPDDVVDLTGPCMIGGLLVSGAGGTPPAHAAIADLVLEPGDDPDDAEPRIIPGQVEPAQAAALAAAAMARALPRDPLHLARLGAALRALAREATIYPETLSAMAAGIAVTARDPDAVRLFSDATRSDEPRGRRLRLPDGHTATVGVGGAIVGTAIGAGTALLLFWMLNPTVANRTTALVVGAIIGALAGAVVALGLLRR